MNNTLKWICAAALVTLISSCSLIKVNSWADPDFKDRPIGKTVVYGIGDRASVSHQYEDVFVTHLLNQGVKAGSLRSSVKDPSKLDRASLEKLLTENEVDSIIVTRILSQGEETSINGINITPMAYVDFWGESGVAIAFAPVSPNLETYQELMLETTLYDVKTQKLVWTGRSEIFDDRSNMDNMRGLVDSIVFDLKKKGLLN